ncbi:MAG: hypothetical protein QOE71_2967 [Pseudonocardiales bacterium]|nr:hypothetical protein [Pseudonocardiales bacterium]
MSDRYFLMNEIPSIGIDTRDGRTRILVGVRSEHWGPTVAHSDDLGQTWIEPEQGAIRFGADDGAALSRVWQIQPDSAGQPGVIWAGCEPISVWKSTDGGSTLPAICPTCCASERRSCRDTGHRRARLTRYRGDLAAGPTAEADGQRRLRVPCDRAITVRDLLAEITTRVPLLGRRLLDETGQLRRFVNLYVEGEDVRRSAELDTPIREGQKVQIIQSVAGG